MIFKLEFPVLTSVTGRGLLLVPTVCDEKIARSGLAVSTGPFTAVPLRGMATGLDGVLSLSVMAPHPIPCSWGRSSP